MNETQLRELILKAISEAVGDTAGAQSAAPVPPASGAVESGEVRDLSAVDFRQIIDVPTPANPEEFRRMRSKTVARIGVWRAGPRCRTNTYLRFRADHAAAMDAVFTDADKVLFAADGFGKFGALDREEPWDDEARRYFIGIVGKYGLQVQKLLKVAGTLDIRKICSLHGPVLTENLGHYIEKYDIRASYRPEEEGVVVAYTSVYGNTKKAAELLADKLKEKGCPNVVVYDLARDDMSAAVADAFRYSKLVLATLTYNAGIYPFMQDFINRLTERSFQNRTIGLIENGSWAPTAAKVMKGMFEKSKNITWTENNVKVMSAVKEENVKEIEALAEELCK